MSNCSVTRVIVVGVPVIDQPNTSPAVTAVVQPVRVVLVTICPAVIVGGADATIDVVGGVLVTNASLTMPKVTFPDAFDSSVHRVIVPA